jgi:tRNA modification GTPase
MIVDFADTIVALSSGRLPSGLAVIRLSGKKARFAFETMVGQIPPPRKAVYREIRNSGNGVIDSGVVLFFEAPHSFTGEDCVEFHLHGGKAVVAACLQALTGMAGIRHAEAGEFTRRAFLNGKLDLLEAEGLADLIASETEAQRRLAIHNSEGAQSALYGGWRRRLIHARAMIEAELDFSDEADVPGSVAGAVWVDVEALLSELRDHLAGYHKAEMIRDGFDVVILGAPNAGKSSLLNALARREAAIVSDEPGTTRDLVELLLDIDGCKLRLTDTAGLRADAGKVEAIGIARARARAETADLVLHLIDMTVPAPADAGPPGVDTVRVGAKCDLVKAPATAASHGVDFVVSSVSGEGIPELLAFLGDKAKAATGSMDVLPSRLRHVALLREAAGHLDAALRTDAARLELRADDLRLAADRLGRISGAVDVEDLLDVIFAQFCIGK